MNLNDLRSLIRELIKTELEEGNTTGTGASFTPGKGAQYALPKAFRIKQNEVGEPFTEPNPSIPNRPSKFIDYKQIFEKVFKELSSSQVNIGVNAGIDMNSLDAANVLEIKGRNRLYFGHSAEQLSEAGSSTNPKQIPNTDFWVITNSNTTRKKMMLTETALKLGYSEQDAERIRDLL